MTLETKVNWLLGLVVALLIALALIFFLRVQPIHSYLGSHEGPDPAEWSGLRGYLKQTARDLRRALNDMHCQIWLLGEHPTEEHGEKKPRPTPCPPGDPGLVPKDPPG